MAAPCVEVPEALYPLPLPEKSMDTSRCAGNFCRKHECLQLALCLLPKWIDGAAPAANEDGCLHQGRG